jgi:hypothetical protein
MAEIHDLLLQSAQPFLCGLNGWWSPSSTVLALLRACSAARLRVAACGSQPPGMLALFNAVQDIALHSRAVDFDEPG